MSVLEVEVWSDVQCSWCYIGKQRFEDAVTQFDGEVVVRHNTFELQPDAATDFDAAAFVRDQRGYSEEERQRMLSGITDTASAEGLTYDFDALKPTNSSLAHQLLYWSDATGKRDELSERLYRAYFTEGRHVGRIDELVSLAGEVGLDMVEARQVLSEGSMWESVATDRQRAQQLGIQSVPFYVINSKYGIAGAQPAAAMLDIFRQLAAEPSR